MKQFNMKRREGKENKEKGEKKGQHIDEKSNLYKAKKTTNSPKVRISDSTFCGVTF